MKRPDKSRKTCPQTQIEPRRGVFLRFPYIGPPGTKKQAKSAKIASGVFATSTGNFKQRRLGKKA